MTAKDVGGDKFRFDVSGLKAGENTLELVNDSKKELHHVIALPLQPGRTVKDVKKFFESDGKGRPPVDFMKGEGTAVLDQKTREVTKLKLPKSGDYVLICGLPDRDGKGKPHFHEGLLKQVKVD